ncbi:hypothetical protein AAG570_010544 [Ranatra chinensis]|uniref:MYCBP-associated protein n=1 Tax=Ranatra chinensis TaxID=642074 RepID=A0ABD0Z0Y6_9HEMI
MSTENNNGNSVVADTISEKVLQLYNQEVPTDDERLKNWSRWLKVRQAQQEALSRATARPPQCLAMNQEAGYELKREKWLIEQAATFIKPDKYRGHPDFWKVPTYLKPGPNRLQTMVHSALENFDRNTPVKVRTRDQWAVPTRTKVEKRIDGPKCIPSPIQLWNKSEHVASKKKVLEEGIQAIGGFRADLRNFIVEGMSEKKVPQREESPSVPAIIVHPPEEEEEEPMLSDVPSHTVRECLPTLKVSDHILAPGNPPNPIQINIEFANCLIYTKYQNSLRLENLGLPAVHYRWKRINPSRHSELPIKLLTKRPQAFFFNICDGVVLPGQIAIVHFWFKTGMTGMYGETWELLTKPRVTESPILISLRAFALRKVFEAPWNYVEEYLNARMSRQDGDIRDAPVEIKQEDIEIPSHLLFEEREIFLNTNPTLKYDKTTVGELKELYQQHFEKPWNYNLRQFILKVIESSFDQNLSKSLLEKIFEAKKTLVIVKEKPPPEGGLRESFVKVILSEAVDSIQFEIDQVRDCMGLPPIQIEFPPPQEQSDLQRKVSYMVPMEEQPMMKKFPILADILNSAKEESGEKSEGKSKEKPNKGGGGKNSSKDKKTDTAETRKKDKRGSETSEESSLTIEKMRNIRIPVETVPRTPSREPAKVKVNRELKCTSWYTGECYKRTYDILSHAMDTIAIYLEDFDRFEHREHDATPTEIQYQALSYRCSPYP